MWSGADEVSGLLSELTSMSYVETLVQCVPYLHWTSLDIVGISDLQHFQFLLDACPSS